MSFDFPADFVIRSKVGVEVDMDTMFRKLDLAAEHNLVHMVDNAQKGFSFMCHCCGCCCGLLTSLNLYNTCTILRTLFRF